MLRISPSLIEQFRIFMLDVYGEMSEQDMITHIEGKRKFNKSMGRGTAYHQIIEFGYEPFVSKKFDKNGSLTDICRIFVEGENKQSVAFDFTKDEVLPAIEYRHRLKNLVHEVPIQKDIIVNGHKVLLNGRADGLLGLQVRECKTTGTQPDIERYMSSMQWRCYLYMLDDATSCHYDVFYIKKSGGVFYQEYTFERYAGLEYDLRYWISQLIDFCIKHNLIKYITLKTPQVP